MNKQELLAELINAIFDDGDDGIEHVDMSYDEFITKMKQLASLDK